MSSQSGERPTSHPGPKIGHPSGGDDGLQAGRTAAGAPPSGHRPPDVPPFNLSRSGRFHAGCRVEGAFLVAEVQVRHGDCPYTILVLARAGARMSTAPFWESDRHRIAGLRRGDVVQVTGTVGVYRERCQLQVESLRLVPEEEANWEEILPSVGPVAASWEQLDRWRAEVTAPRLRAVLALFYGDARFRARYERCPASPAGHHAALGGLLLHTVEVAGLASELARRFPAADPDLLLAGALLHDIGKLEAYHWRRGFGTTVAGHAIGHVVLGALMLERAVRRAPAPPCTESELLLLQHLVLSHHGRLDFGAPVVPMTLEAELLHHADLASARGAAMDEALRDSANFPDAAPVSARGVWQLDHRKLWRSGSDWGRSGAIGDAAVAPSGDGPA